MKKNKTPLFKTFMVILLLFFSLFLFVKHFCVVTNVRVTGLELVDKSCFNKIPIRYKENIFSVDREKISKYFLTIPLIEEVNIKTVLFNTLLIKVKEKDVVGIIKTKKKLLYITSKYELIPKKIRSSSEFLPLIEIEKKITYKRLLGILKGLTLLKHYDKNFFKKIKKISLKEPTITNIFIRDRIHALLNPIPSEVDFLKLLIIAKVFNSGSFDLRGDYIIKIKT